MKKIFTVIFSIAVSAAVSAQTLIWTDPLENGAQVHGQGWSELRSTYVRLPESARGRVSENVWWLSHNSAGLSLRFKARTSCMKFRYGVYGDQAMFHMPSTGVSGLDLYATGSDGKQKWCSPDFPPSFKKDTICYSYSHIDPVDCYEYELYLPLYNTVTWLEIGLPEGVEPEFIPVGDEKPVVIYGTSITQGACASRPGNAWPAICGRTLDLPVVNLGFSGSALGEIEMFELLGSIDARAYVIDCMANMNGIVDRIVPRIVAGVEKIRETRDCPVLLVEYCGRQSEVNDVLRHIEESNAALREAYSILRSRGVKNIYYLKGGKLGLCMEDTVEGLHMNDVGMRHEASSVAAKIKKILK